MLKDTLTSPDFKREFTVETGANGLPAMLTQGKKVIAYASPARLLLRKKYSAKRLFTSRENACSQTERGRMISCCLEFGSVYAHGREAFRTDHKFFEHIFGNLKSREENLPDARLS